MTKYTAPDSHNLIFNFEGDTYTAPDAHNVVFNFGVIEDKRQYVTSLGFDSSQVGSPDIRSAIVTIYAASFDSFAYGGQNIRNNARIVQASGIGAYALGVNKVYNSKQIVNLTYFGLSSFSDGKTFVIGGVKYVQPSGLQAALFGTTVVKDPKGPQTLRPVAFNAFGMGSVNVSPRILKPSTFVATLIGSPIVRRNPSPLGIVATQYGQAWISHSPRYYQPAGFDSLQSGYPKIFDPTQKVIQQLTPIPGAIFGDISIRNQNFRIIAKGIDQSSFSDWASFESNLRYIQGAANNLFSKFGEGSIYNKTPSLAPKGWSGVIGQHSIAFYIRRINTSGISQYGYGKPTLTQPPSLIPKGLDATLFGSAFISNYRRTLEVLGHSDSRVGNLTTWHYTRAVKVTGGIYKFESPKPTIEHSNREIIGSGKDASSYGNNTTIGYRVRTISVASIAEIFRSNHGIVVPRYLGVIGFDGLSFGTRIIPENQEVLAPGFSNNLDYGLGQVQNKKNYLKPSGFNTENEPNHGRWGTAKFYNLRQYVSMFYDVDSLLNPPKDNSKWTVIANRNKELLFYGTATSIVPRPSVANKATAILPVGINSLLLGKNRTSHYRQYLKPESMEPPYISGWANLSNKAKVLKPVSNVMSLFGLGSIENNRRYRKAHGFETIEIGHPFIAYRIRELTFENRYSIGPVRIDLPKVELFKRYIEPQGMYFESFGSIELFRYQARMTTRWTHKDYLGEPTVRNVTPELKVKSLLGEDFGRAELKLWRRYLKLDGFIATLNSKPRIEFANRYLPVSSIAPIRVPENHKIERTGSQPYSRQWISLHTTAPVLTKPEDAQVGFGIPIPGENYEGWSSPYPQQVSIPNVNEQHIWVRNELFQAHKMGQPSITANTLRVEPGFMSFKVGEHFISSTIRTITVGAFGDVSEFIDSRPIVSPFTIWAPTGAPQQARANHPLSKGEMPIDSEIVVGHPKIENRHRKLNMVGSNFYGTGSHKIELKRRYINVDGFTMFRFGFHSLPERNRILEQHTPYIGPLFGTHKIAHPIHYGPTTIKPPGISQPTFNLQVINFFHRQIKPSGLYATIMGNSVQGDREYYPQRLAVYFKRPILHAGVDTSLIGKTSISHLVQYIRAQSFDSFISTYTTNKFKDRIQVKLKTKPQPILEQVIGVGGFKTSEYSTPDIKLAVHYIRPDGNSDQSRKGVLQ